MRPLDPAVLPHLRPARRQLAGVVAVAVAQAGLVVAQAFIVAGTVVAVVEGTPLRAWLIALGSVVGARMLATLAGDVLAADAAGRVGVALRRTVLARALEHGPTWLAERRRGELTALATRGVAAIEPYLTRYVPAALLAATLPGLTLLAIAWQDWLSALIVLLTLPLVPVFAALVGWRTQSSAQRQWRAMATLAGHFVDVVKGLPTLVVFRRAEAQTRRVRAITHEHRRATLATLRLAFASSAVLELVATISVALVAVAVGLRLQSGSLDLDTALVVLLLAPEAYWPLRRMGAEFHAAAEGGATFAEVNRLITRDDPDAPAGRHAVAGRGAVAAEPREIVLDRVSVTYPGRTTPALAEVSGVIGRRGIVAVVGPSGAGKSTLLAALRGELPLATGEIRVDGAPLDTLDPRVWRQRIAWLPQRPWLLPGTVADNVRLARPAASDAQVWDALRRVQLADVVAGLPGGLDAVVTEDGASLSAGERARLALARAVVSDRPIVLLDEPTAHLDAATEHVILDTLRWLAERSVVVVVAHRQAVVDLADTVISVQRPACTIPPETRAAAPTEEASKPAVATAQTDPADAATADAAGSDPRRRLWLAALLGSLASASGVALTATAGWLIVRASEHPPVLFLMVAIVGVRTFGIARPVLRYVERLVSHDAALASLAEFRARVYSALIPLTPGRLGRRRGDVLASVVDDVDAYVDRRLRVWLPTVTAAFVGVGTTAFAAWLLPVTAAAIAAVLLVGGVLAWLVSRAVARRAERRLVAQRAVLSDRVLQVLDGAADVTAWGAERRMLDRVTSAGRGIASAQVRTGLGIGTGKALVVGATGLGVAALAWLTAEPVADGSLSAAMAALLVLVPLGLAEALLPLADAGALESRTAQALGRISDLERQSPAVRDPAAPVTVPPRPHGVHLQEVAAGWGDVPIVHGVDLDLEPGGTVAVVGPSGCGKTTLAAVLLRFLDPVDGIVRLDAVSLRDLSLDDVRREIGLVDDDPHVFGSTLVENIRLARPDATDADVDAALRRAQLGPWLDSLPEGLHTWLGDGGADVSGGERARLALARSLLADQPVLVLDEPVAHLDSATAEAVTADLLDASTGRTVVLISHRDEGLDRVDQVLDLSTRQFLVRGTGVTSQH